MIELKLPELGENIDQAEVSRVLVKEGDTVQADQNVLELESDKASFPLPSTHAGRVAKIRVKVGDTVSVGQTLLEIDESQSAPTKDKKPAKEPAPPQKSESAKEESEQRGETRDGDGAAAKAKPAQPKKKERSPAKEAPAPETEPEPAAEPSEPKQAFVPAGPATRALARELGVPLEEVHGHGPGGRITREDVKAFTKSRFEPETPAEEQAPSEFPGPVTRERLSPLARTTAQRLSLAWRTVPHVTQHDLADITELEKGRQAFNESRKGAKPKLTATVLALRAAVIALKAFPRFNSSLDEKSGELIVKNYYHLGVAVDTEHGLLVPTIRDADRKSLVQLAAELAELAAKARDRTLTKKDMEGGTFTITNLGGIGGTAFTPIVNYPEVAILGISRASWQIVAGETKQEKRLLLPLSLSYDHRVVNGADGARFLVMVCQLLANPFQLLAES